MLLSKKDTPKEFMGMYYAGVLNLAVGMFNAFNYAVGGYFFMWICACLSVGIAITIFMVIKRKTHAITWAKLTKREESSGLELG